MIRLTLAALFVAVLALTASNTAVAADMYESDVVNAYTTDQWTLPCSRSGDTMIIVDGDGDTDLDLHVYDSYGNLVAAHTDYYDYCVVNFHAYAGQTYFVEVSNLGNVWNAYTLGINP